jgi:hypothetical protein
VPERRSDLCKKYLLMSAKLMEFVPQINAKRDPNNVQTDYFDIQDTVIENMSKVNKETTFHVDLQKHFIFLLDKIAKNDKGKSKKNDELNFWDFFKGILIKKLAIYKIFPLKILTKTVKILKKCKHCWILII